MTEQELQAIEERWAKWINPKSAPKTLGGSFLILLAEVRRLNRMVDKAIDRLEGGCCDAPQSFDCEESNRNCRDCWKERLESEVAEK